MAFTRVGCSNVAGVRWTGKIRSQRRLQLRPRVVRRGSESVRQLPSMGGCCLARMQKLLVFRWRGRRSPEPIAAELRENSQSGTLWDRISFLLPDG